MSDWKTTELFIARSSHERSEFAVGIAIAALGNRKDGGFTYASLDRIAKLARVDRKTAWLAVNALADSGELEYIAGTSRYHRSRYRIRVEVLSSGVDRFRSPLTIGDTPTMKQADRRRHAVDETPFTTGVPSVDHRRDTVATVGGTPSISVKNRSLDQISDQSAREPARFSDPTKSWTRTEEDDRALKAAFEACRRSVDTPAGEDADPAVKLGDAVAVVAQMSERSDILPGTESHARGGQR